MASAESDIQKPDELSKVPVLDPKALGHIMEVGDGEAVLLKELLGMFEHDQPLRLNRLRAAVNLGDMKTIRDLSHAIKGSAGTMGASRLRVAAGLLEAHGMGRPAVASREGLFELLESAYDEARLALGEYVKMHSSNDET